MEKSDETLIIDGAATAEKVRGEASAMLEAARENGVEAGLAVILVGEDPASQTYVRLKTKDAAECGIRTFDHRLPVRTTQAQLEALIDECNADPAVHGILVQLPIPDQLDPEAAIARISPEKDVDGFSPDSLGRLVRGLDGMRSCTPAGIMRLLEEYDIDVAGQHVVIVGRSTIVGKPLALLMLNADATVTVCHSKTSGLADICREADILVAAVGRPSFISADMVREGAVVIDVGINRTKQGTFGDVDFDAVAPHCSAITPVPGGVGPMTRAMLMLNTADAASAVAARS